MPQFAWFCLVICAVFSGGILGVGVQKWRTPPPVSLPPQLPLYEIESRCRDQIRKEAAEAGVAYYELNHKTGQIEFHYVDMQRVIQQVAQQLQQQMREVSPLQ